jgi:hypothetical protein
MRGFTGRVAVWIFQATERAVCTQRATNASSIMNTNGLDAPEERRGGTK